MDLEKDTSLSKTSKRNDSNVERITYSKNVFLPVTNLCRNRCAYCGFRGEPGNGAWIMSKEEILELVKRGKKAGCSEALITCGERPEKYDMMREKLDDWNYETFVDYIIDLSKEILKLNVLPHTNLGVLEKSELKRLRKWNASMGLMLESAVELPAHDHSPGKTPGLRLEMIENAGKLKIPFTTGILIGIGENWRDRITSLVKIRELHKKYGHIQEVIVQPFLPKSETPMEDRSRPDQSKILNTILTAKSIMPNMSIQIPPNLTDNYLNYLLVGVRDLGGISNITPDFINPDRPWPKIEKLEKELENKKFELKERLPIYPEFVKKPGFMSSEIKEVVKTLSDKEGYRRR